MNLIAKICGAAAMALSVLGATAAAAGTIEDIRSRGVLRIPAILNEVPYFNKDPRTGEWQGFVIDMANDIAKTLDVKLEVVESSWANAILDVQSGKVDMAFAVTATPVRAMSVSFSDPTYYNSFILVSAKEELNGKTWKELNDPKYTFAVDMGSAQDLITQQYLPQANVLRFKTRDEAIIAVSTGKADALVNTMLNGLVIAKKAATIGSVKVPTPVLSTPSVIAVNYAGDETFKSFVSAWAEYNRRIGNNQTWILKSLEPFGITLTDMPVGFGFGG
ncbi:MULTISPECIES: transporter substrate-binding domain-containing protein [Alphaproteobacteria]|uniref:ABC transporter substrate-binding protein n=2 Tax=Alphaproteobacteria TaxID=28211 RepID=A0A512HP29_9HYPH|nr:MULTISPECIES: transporter substrate-binding domain-containing protein [Alphaproteobacteria]GEO87191.1 ABC transporter substrate-binding protein [Ciceribacter naphthalenivorans]GLR23079.1 ABC transporter substrate-binding protein [Ciceribacter naphthalenivorans]GLT05935.1 ABC transporter substrate-binding protein [Sphingomonas psychrolutea]